MNLHDRQQHWMSIKAAKLEKVKLEKETRSAEQLPRAPDLTKTKESWLRAKKQHEEQILRANLEEELKAKRELEGVAKKRLKLAERVKELKRLSKLNEVLVSEDVLAAGEAAVTDLMEGEVCIKGRKKKKKKKKIKKKDGMIQYSSSALELFGTTMEENEESSANSVDVNRTNIRHLSAPTRRNPVLADSRPRPVSGSLVETIHSKLQPSSDSILTYAEDEMSLWLAGELRKRGSRSQNIIDAAPSRSQAHQPSSLRVIQTNKEAEVPPLLRINSSMLGVNKKQEPFYTVQDLQKKLLSKPENGIPDQSEGGRPIQPKFSSYVQLASTTESSNPAATSVIEVTFNILFVFCFFTCVFTLFSNSILLMSASSFTRWIRYLATAPASSRQPLSRASR